MTTTTTAPPDFDKLEHEAESNLATLRRTRGGLTLDALRDPKAKARLEKVEAEVSDAEAHLARIEEARIEQSRRDEAAAKAAAEREQLAALDEASQLQSQREAVAEQIDAAIVELTEQMSAYFRIASQQASWLRQGGREPAAQMATSATGYRIEAAIAHQLVSIPDGHRLPVLERMPQIRGEHRKPLIEAEREGRPIAPAESK